ncbi:hypothetical protein CERSUDRAFT_127086 [Gelatoporia subvermispora B]|uniref:BIR-domain-containing protein n=1 Tax=Ceriporiopsis subvermispora (strain B) TaxID=914234 RepID=M2Q549_CERS8|nr:hypothetical protein CERSUDRAFT_127086 [Gelatoporia subvermispora B]
MEALQARLASFAKSKKIKSLSSKSSGSFKWPHPSTYKATPNTLAEAGFYFDPTSEYRDNVVCFMCRKELSDWDEDDDPFSIHWSKCRNNCPWAIVRCGLVEDLDRRGNFTFPNSTRLPNGKAMEKARLDTFTSSKLWPHDAVRGHGASSKKMAKAGFVYTPQGEGDDTATCLYCNLSLSGWDEDDDPMAEHLKRENKSGTPCPFFQSTQQQSLGKSTSKPPSKVSSKPPSRSTSQTKSRPTVEEDEVSGSADELATAPRRPSRARPSRAPSKEGRASSVASKTPASRRSTRTGTTEKTPASLTTAGSEQEETEAGSGSDAGKRVSKSKKKAGSKGRSRPTMIAEEEEGAPVPPVEDMPVEEPAPEEKPKRGRPPKVAKPPKADEGDVEHTDVEPPQAKETHTRTRSRTNAFASEPDNPVPSSSKPTHARTKSTSKAKTKPTPPAQLSETHNPSVIVEIPVARHQREEPLQPAALEDELVVKPASKAKPSKRPPPKPRKAAESSDVDMAPAAQAAPTAPETVDHDEAQTRAPATTTPQEPSRPSTSSEDAGYATAEPTYESVPQRAAASGSRISTDPKPDVVMNSAGPEPTRPAGRSSRQQTLDVSSSRSGSSDDVSSSRKHTDRGKLKVVEISSDEEQSGVATKPKRPPPPRASGSSRRGPSSVLKNVSTAVPDKADAEQLRIPTATPPVLQRHADDIRDVDQDTEMHDDALPPPETARVVEPSTPPLRPVTAVPSTPPARATPMDVDDAEGKAGESGSPDSFIPFLSQHLIHKLDSITEEEGTMTIEQYLRRELERQYMQFKEDAEREIATIHAHAAETKRRIEAL